MLGRKITKVCQGFSHNISLKHVTPIQKESYLKAIEEQALVDYKVYPAAPHQDPKSPEYVASELDEYHDKVDVQAYNEIIDQLKYDLKLQREVWDAISKLDRPYKKGIRGIDTNLNPNGPTQIKLPDIGYQRYDDVSGVPVTYRNEDRFIMNTPFHMKDDFKHIVEWEKEKANRPVTKNFNHAKGYKYDVPIKPEEKYQYVADRLGHPEFVGTPFERLLRLENDLYHPAYTDQPFIKTPSPSPHPDLNFEQGEVLYENTRVLEWARAFMAGGVIGLAYGGVYIPLNILFKTNLVTDKADELFLAPYHLVSPYNMDALKLFIPITAITAYYLVHSSMNIIQSYAGEYAVKASYSKDRELLFVKRMSTYGQIVEEIFETAHLEILPPKQRSGVKDLSSQDEDGIWRVTCLNTGRCILLYNDPAHWNRKLKDQFLANRFNLWDKSYYGYNRPEQAEMDRKWKEESENLIKQDQLPAK